MVNSKLMFTEQQVSELQEKYNAQVQQCSDLSKKLAATEVNFLNIMLLDAFELF